MKIIFFIIFSIICFSLNFIVSPIVKDYYPYLMFQQWSSELKVLVVNSLILFFCFLFDKTEHETV